MIETILRVLCTATIFAAVYLLQTNRVLLAVISIGLGLAIIIVAVRLAPNRGEES